MTAMKAFFKRYSHAWPLCYIFIYLPWFFWLERTVDEYTVMHCVLDDYIPFCEYFIIPYLFWFFYIAGLFALFLFKGTKKEFYQCCAYLFSGMTIALLICTFFPNGQVMRPVLDETPTVFTNIVQVLFAVDTNTNVFPSIHTFNSVAIHMALCNTGIGRSHKGLRIASCIAMVSICLSTVFLKQHSVLDMMGGILLAAALYAPIYHPEQFRLHRTERQERLTHQR